MAISKTQAEEYELGIVVGEINDYIYTLEKKETCEDDIFSEVCDEFNTVLSDRNDGQYIFNNTLGDFGFTYGDYQEGQ